MGIKIGSIVEFTGGMPACLHGITLGKSYTVAGVCEDGDYYIKDDNNDYNFALNTRAGQGIVEKRVGAEYKVV